MDLAKTFGVIEGLLDADNDAISKINTLIDKCSVDFKSERWNDIRGIDWGKGFDELGSYVSNCVTNMGPDTNAIYVGISNYQNMYGDDVADFYLAGSTKFTTFDPEINWAYNLSWYADPSDNSALSDMYQIAYMDGEDKLGNNCEYPIALGFVTFGLKEKLGLFSANIKCIVGGFDSGDFLFIKK